MSVLKMMFAKHAPTHYAEVYSLTHDEFLNLVEARRGRGKSYGAVEIALAFLKEMLPGIMGGTRPFTKIYTNNRFNLRRMALYICKMGWCPSYAYALHLLEERVVYLTGWDEVLTAYDSLILMDEANRNINVYDSSKEAQQLMLTVHDWLQQTRKHKLTLWFFVQDVEWIKPQLRQLMDRLWRAKRVWNKGRKTIKSFPWYGGDPFAKGKGEAISRGTDWKMRFQFKLDVARIYDTRQAISTLLQETSFKTFEEISDYMYARGLKPLPSPKISDALSYLEVQELMQLPYPPAGSPSGLLAGGGPVGGVLVPRSVVASVLARAPLHGPPVPPGYRRLPLPPVDLSGLPVSIPKHLL